MYRDGQFVDQDYKIAFKYYLLAAEQGDSHAQTDLGTFSSLHHLHLHLLLAALPREFPRPRRTGCLLVVLMILKGALYFNGTGVPQDLQKGVGYWMQAAESENETAMAILGNYLTVPLLLPDI